MAYDGEDGAGLNGIGGGIAGLALSPAPIRSPDPANADALARLAEYAEAARGAFAANTERAIRADLAVFTAWCHDAGLAAFPAAPATLVRFIDEIGPTPAPATVRRYVASLAHLHRAAGLPSPAADNVVRLALRRLARSKGVAQRQAEGLTRRWIDRMLDAAGDTMRDLRNRALLAVAYDTLGRRSELVALTRADLAIAADGHASVRIRRSKTDQEGKGAECYLAPDTVRLLAAWLEAAGIAEGPLFRGVLKGSRLGKPLHAGEVARLFKAMAQDARFDPALVAGISAHSSRVGAAQDMAASDRIELPAIMQAGRWATPTMVARYTSKQATRRSGAAKLAELQNRG